MREPGGPRRHTVKVKHPDRLSVNLPEGPHRRQSEAVISAERHELWPPHGRAERPPFPELRERLSHLLQRNAIVHGRDGHVTAVDDVRPALVRVDARARVVPAEGGLARRGLADGAGAEAGAGPVADGRVKGNADDGDIVELRGRRQALCVLEMGEGTDAGEGYGSTDGQ